MTIDLGGYAHAHAYQAYQITDDEHSFIAWGRNYGEARRFGAQGLERDWDDVECERYPELDGFTGDLLGWMLEKGWYFECTECLKHCGLAEHGYDGCVRDDHQDIYCSEACRKKYRDYWDTKEALEAEFQKFAEVKFFGLMPRVQYVNVGGDALVSVSDPIPNDRHRYRVLLIDRAELGALPQSLSSFP